MRAHVVADYPALCSAVAEEVIAQLGRKPGSVLVFPTGNTPLGLFEVLVRAAGNGKADFRHAQVVILDEYADLRHGDPRSLTGWLKRALLEPVGLPASRTHGFEDGPDALEHKIVELGGLDLVILGLGPNGHLGFNEPGSGFESRARRVDLTPESIRSNAAYWGSEDRVPRQGLTLGLGTITEARAIILMASGAGKARILSDALNGPVTPQNPATVLRNLKHARLYADQPAMRAAPG